MVYMRVFLFVLYTAAEKILAKKVVIFKSHQYYVRKVTTEVEIQDIRDDENKGNAS